MSTLPFYHDSPGSWSRASLSIGPLGWSALTADRLCTAFVACLVTGADGELGNLKWTSKRSAGPRDCGRHAWGGRHPLDLTAVVLTRRPPQDRPVADANFVFVTDGIESAIATAKEIAGDKNVGVNGGQMASGRSRCDAGSRRAA